MGAVNRERGLYVPTTRRNYLIELYSVLSMGLFLLIAALVKDKPLNPPNIVFIILLCAFTFTIVQYLLTKKSIIYWMGDHWIRDGQSAKLDMITNLLCLVVGLFFYLLL